MFLYLSGLCHDGDDRREVRTSCDLRAPACPTPVKDGRVSI